jgi:hypothetical protein
MQRAKFSDMHLYPPIPIPAATSWQPKPGGALFGDPLFGAAAADRQGSAAKGSPAPAPTDKTVSTVLGEVTCC